MNNKKNNHRNVRRNRGQTESNNTFKKNNPPRRNNQFRQNRELVSNNGSNDENQEIPEESNENTAQSGKFNIKNIKNINVKIKIFLIVIVICSVLLLLMILSVMISSLAGSVVGATTTEIANLSEVPVDNYYEITCTEVTVNSVDGRQGGTYELEDYVAGVVNAEVGMLDNIEVYKLFAIAARTYLVYNYGSSCTIDNSDTTQTFEEVSESTEIGNKIIQAVASTKGQVLLDEDGNLMNAQYDAFCTTEVDDEYYTIKQKNQKVPRDWADNQPGIEDKWKTGEEVECHGNGASQWGAYYLAEEGSPYTLILNYYYSTDNNRIRISSPRILTSIEGLEIKNTTGASNTLKSPIDTFLQENGSSLSECNSYIKDNVTAVSVGTREAVVTAAVSMINYLYDNFNTVLPYYWGGYSMNIGLPSSIGSYNPSEPSVSGMIYEYQSFDCSGFVSWAIRNGGYRFTRLTTTDFEQQFGQYGCDITESSCKGQPGDLINSIGHVKMIVSVDESNNIYYVAESTTRGVIIQTHGMHTPISGQTKILHMDNFYNNPDNVDPNY